MKKIIFILLCIFIIILAGCTNKIADNDKLTVAVSIIPEETFVKAVAGDLVNVVTMVPPGASPETFQPTTKQMISLSNSKIYFAIGVPTESANILPKLNDINKEINVVKLQDKVSEVYPHIEFEDADEQHKESEEHIHEGVDPHIWTSPKRVKIMINTILDELIKIDPENEQIYTNNAQNFISELDAIDNEIVATLEGRKNQSFIIFHPSMGYFADDYELDMIAIEEEGKEATAKRIKEVIDIAKEKNIKFVFNQEEFDNSQAKAIADQIGGVVVQIAPLSPNYIENLREIANKFEQVLK